MYTIRLSLILITVLCLSQYANSQEFVLYGTAGGSCITFPAGQRSLHIVNPITGQMQFVGTPGFNGITALAYLDDGRLLATGIQDSDTSILIEINPSTGQGTLIGVIGNDNNPGECSRIPGLTYESATDTLYGLARNCNGIGEGLLVTINPDTAEMTPIGEPGFNGGGFGLAIRGDGTLFASVWNGNTFSLFTVNKLTGASNLVGTMDASGVAQNGLAVGGIAFHPITQELFASGTDNNLADGYLLTIDESVPPSFNVQGQTVDCFDGLVFVEGSLRNVPTISQWGLIATAAILGIIGFIVIRRRQITT